MKLRALGANKKNTIYWCGVETLWLYGQLKNRPYEVFQMPWWQMGQKNMCIYSYIGQNWQNMQSSTFRWVIYYLHAFHIDTSTHHDHLVFLKCEIVRYTSLGLLVNVLRRWQKDPSYKTDKNASLDILSDDLHESWAYYMLTRRNRCRILSNLRQIFTSSHVAEGKFWSE